MVIAFLLPLLVAQADVWADDVDTEVPDIDTWDAQDRFLGVASMTQ
jgi:hypothetical protein